MEWLESVHVIIGDTGSDITWWQMSLRGLLIFVYAFVLFSLSRRALSRSSPVDVVVAVIVGSALSRALTANVPLVPTLAATLTIVLFHSLLSFLAARFPKLGHILVQGPRRIVYRGEIDWPQMRRARLTRDDLNEALRESGTRGLEGVRAAYLEPDGRISIIRDGD